MTLTAGKGSTPRVVVFVGPSCPPSVVTDRLACDVRAPARRGDLYAVGEEGADVIVLIDGYLVHDYPPSPAEVADVVAAGVPVVGGASLGALRAVELRHRGVEGVGWVYERYLDGTIDADDEVVVSIDPRTGSPTSVPLARVRFALECMVRDDEVTEPQAASLIARLRNVYFAERTRDEISQLAMHAGIDDVATLSLLDDRYDIKRADTLAALQRGREVAGARSPV